MELKNNKLHISLEDINQSMKGILNRIEEDMNEPDILLCLTRGGLVPTGIYSYAANIKNIINMSLSSYEDEKQGDISFTSLNSYEIDKLNEATSIMIVDDIIDTGITIDTVIEHLKNNLTDFDNKDINIFTIVNKSKKYKNVYSIIERSDDTWIVFEWDK